MADQGPLIVPIRVEALVVNDDVRTVQSGDGFIRAQMDYAGAFQTGEYDNAEPAPFTNDVDFVAQPGTTIGNGGPTVSNYYNGVYLKWRLPDALTQGAQDNQSGETAYPLVPNRWLVVRVGGADLSQRQASAWIVESDYQWAQIPSAQNYGQTASTFLVGATPEPGLIGQSVTLDSNGWSEPGTPMFLTGVGPGSPAFAVYQPYNNNVFSFMDALNAEPAQSLSYLVIGWYSDATQDPLASATQSTFADLLASLGWQLPSGVDPTQVMTTSSLYVGQVTNVPWGTTGAPTATGAPAAEAVQVAMGSTSAEALATLVAQQASSAGDQVDASLLESFQLGLLRSYDEPDAAPLLQQQLLASKFQSFSGGYGWDIVNAPGADTSGLTETEVLREATLLATLNQNQAALDASMLQLAALQQQLYAMWWKYEFWFNANPAAKANSLHLTQDDIAKQLDPTSTGSLAQQVQQQAAVVSTNTTQVPWGATPDQLTASIAAYAQQIQLPSSRLLKRYQRSRFMLPNNPVVLLSGAGAENISASQGAITCRLASLQGQLVTGFEYQGTNVTSSGLTITTPTTGTLTGVAWAADTLAPLLTEFFFLDPLNATAIVDAGVITGSPSVSDVATVMADPADNAIGVVPSYGTGDWGTTQPWHPLFLMWQANYYPMAYGTASVPNWTYGGDETGFAWNGQGGSTEPLALQGSILLTPGAMFNLQAQIQQFLSQNPNLPTDEIDAIDDLLTFIQGQAGDEQPGNAGWDFLSQALDGFNDMLLSRAAGAFPAPEMASVGSVSASTLATLIGSAPMYPPALGNLPETDTPTTTFQPWLAGQFVFTNLAVVDEWGQTVFLTDPSEYQSFQMALPPEMTPSQTVISGMSGAVAQFGPGLLQPGRLDFDLVSASDDSDVLGMDAGVNPITGWILPNHLDGSLMAFDNQGNALGELTAGVASTQPVWLPSPGSPYPSFAATTAALPHFGPFLEALQSLSLASFNAFLAAVDETLWASPPVGLSFNSNLSALIGRPLALVRARLMFELNGPPIQDPAWQFTSTPASSPVPGYAFDIQLGTSTDLSDGLVGYFLGDTYTTFNVVPQAGTAAGQNAYLDPIGAGNFMSLPFDGQTAAYVSILVDPRAGVTANTGILPVATVTLPPAFVGSALAAMNVTFRMGPLVVDQSVTAGGATTLLLPQPAGHLGQWSWMENDASGWTSYALATPDGSARLSNALPTLRTGLLTLKSSMSGE